jgi:hypothetical protein
MKYWNNLSKNGKIGAVVVAVVIILVAWKIIL